MRSPSRVCSAIESVGQEFDPHFHHAIDTVETSEHAEGTGDRRVAARIFVSRQGVAAGDGSRGETSRNRGRFTRRGATNLVGNGDEPPNPKGPNARCRETIGTLRSAGRGARSFSGTNQVRLPQSGDEMASGSESGEETGSGRNFRQAAKLIACFLTRRSARSTTGTGMRGWQSRIRGGRFQCDDLRGLSGHSRRFIRIRRYLAEGRRRGGARRTRAAGRGLALRLVADFEEAATGVRRRFIFRAGNVRNLQRHGRETGHGACRLARLRRARECPYSQGFFSITRTCPACQGAGQVIREACVIAGGKDESSANARWRWRSRGS